MRGNDSLMSKQREGRLGQAGRLFAALAVLRLAAGEDTRLRTPEDRRPGDHPRGRINDVQRDLYELLTTARDKGGEHWEAAAAAFRSIPDFLEGGNVPHGSLNDPEFAAFKAGYEAQIAVFRDKSPRLLT
ncbi:hypothetical protein FB563_3928 [Streptomyces puniciscabiei]|uniref:Uncharacterized protein n=1 Tax=Streptomyces puniciscabiei TaxID=164348 RepID=A0A542UIH0_9ACTN|nr:hypothetical protein FB563_3928 [Streptomyces puniciscabiei]